MPITEATYKAILLEDPEGQWELIRGQLKEKPAMSVPHNRTMARLAAQLTRQLDENDFEVRTNTGRLRHADESYFLPDVHVVPVTTFGADSAYSVGLEVLDAPMPFVAEVWSPSTGSYDVDRKLPEYQRRGDLEIWRVHPYDRTVRIWRRSSDGTYTTEQRAGGVVRLIGLHDVSIDLDAMFIPE